MARKKNATFAGGTVVDTDVGAPTFSRLLADAAGDAALTFDKATGSNGETGVIVHDGASGTGALLGVPIINAYVGRTLLLKTPTAKGSSGGLGDTWIYACPFHLAAGESEITVEVSMYLPLGEMKPYAKVCTTANVEVTRQSLVPAAESSNIIFTARLKGLSAGFNLFFVGIDTSKVDADTGAGVLNYVRVRPVRRLLAQVTMPGIEGSSIFGVTAPAAAEGLAHVNFDSTMFASLEPVDGYTLAYLNRNKNGLLEFISGFPAGGNAAYTHVDHDGAAAPDTTNPARSRFEAHTRSLYANEGELDFPVWCEGFGAFLAAGKFVVGLAEPPTVGLLDWYAPWPRTVAEQAIRSAPMCMPDFQSGTSRLKCAVLLGSEASAAVNNWTIKCKTTTGNATAVPAAVDGTNNLWLATITAVPFTGDADELVEIRMSRGGGAKTGIGEVCVLGACLAFDP